MRTARPLTILACLLALSGCAAVQRSVLYHPTHHINDRGLARWTHDDALIGFAREAYASLRSRFPGTPVCVVAESIGSGPAATLASLKRPPEKFVFIVPFDRLPAVGNDYVSSALASPVLAGTWNNVAALKNYQGPLDVFGAKNDKVIQVRHAQALANSRPQSKFHLFDGGHNDWASQPGVRIRYP